MIDLLQFSIERIDSLQICFQQELKSINRRVTKGKKENRFGYLLDLYLTVRISNDIEIIGQDSFKSLEDYIKKHVEIIEPIENGRVFYQIKNLEALKAKRINLDIKNAAILYRRYNDMSIIHTSNTLIMLLIRFEEYISNVLKNIYEMFPTLYLDSQDISYSEIQKRDLDEIKEYILNREVERTMRESFTKWFDILKRHKIILDECDEELAQLKEIYARRNIIVHNGGEVNSTYLKNSGNNSVKIGDHIRVDEVYLNSAFNCIKTLIYEIALKSSKLFKNREQEYLECIFDTAFEELKSKNYIVSKTIFQTLMNTKVLSNEYKNMSMINCYIARNEMGENIQNDINKFDVSALENRFKIAKLVLQNEYGEAISIIEEEIKNDSITPNIFEWPLFIHFIKTNEYKELKKKHKKFFGLAVIDVTDQKTNDVKVSDSSVRKDVEASKNDE